VGVTYCVECGEAFPQGTAFCPRCGKQSNTAAPAASLSAPVMQAPPAPTATPYVPPPTSAYPAYTRPPTNGMATAGFVLSLVSIFLSVLIVPVILGVIFSAIGISRANEFERTTGQPIGRGLAVAGLVISLIMVFFSFLWLVFWI